MLTDNHKKNAASVCRLPGRRLLIIFLILCAAVAVGGPGFPQEQSGSQKPGLDQILEESGVEDFPVYLYFVDKENDYLISEVRRIREKQPVQTYCRHIVEELLSGPRGEGLVRTLPQGTALRAVYVTDEGVAYLDFTAPIADKHPGGIRTELMTVYSIVNTLVLNVSAVDRVKLLIEGQETETLAGHMDTRFPLKADMLLVR